MFWLGGPGTLYLVGNGTYRALISLVLFQTTQHFCSGYVLNAVRGRVNHSAKETRSFCAGEIASTKEASAPYLRTSVYIYI